MDLHSNSLSKAGLNYNATPYASFGGHGRDDVLSKLMSAMQLQQPQPPQQPQPGVPCAQDRPQYPVPPAGDALPRKGGCKRKGKRERARARQLRERQEAEARAAEDAAVAVAAATDMADVFGDLTPNSGLSFGLTQSSASIVTTNTDPNASTLQTATPVTPALQQTRLRLYQALMFGEDEEDSPVVATPAPINAVHVVSPDTHDTDSLDDCFPPLGSPLQSPLLQMRSPEAAAKAGSSQNSHDQLTSENESRGGSGCDSDSDSDDSEDELMLLPGGLL